MAEEQAPRTGPVLAVFAHPDDMEICAGGTLAGWASTGRAVHLLVLTNGDRGSSDATLSRSALAVTRLRETEAAAELLGFVSARVLSTHDGELENTLSVREAVVRRVREVQAETVVSCDPTAVFFGEPGGTATYYNHSDHRTAGWIALDSAFPGSGNPHFFSEHLGEGLEVQEVLDVWLGWTNDGNRISPVDADSFRTKVNALGCHASQITEGIAYWDEALGKDARRLGGQVGAEFAEEFRVLDLS
jgi:LmbE family N-acetylglucosaminyl deacetylase